MMSMTQLEEAVKYYRLHHATLQSTTISLTKVRRVMANHWRSCLKLPAGGAHAGGSQQTGFDMEMIDPATARVLFRGWPNYQSIRWGHSWECRTMEEIAAVLSFEDALSGYGVANIRPAALKTGYTEHTTILVVAPPLTVTCIMRQDTTTMLSVRFPFIMYTEEDATILPPDTSENLPFYLDPSNQPGYHRDLFRDHARRAVHLLEEAGYPLSRGLLLQAVV